MSDSVEIRVESLPALRKAQREAEHYQLPDNPADYVELLAKEIARLPDEVPQKAVMLRHIESARQALSVGSERALKVVLTLIQQDWPDADFNVLVLKERARAAETSKIASEKGKKGAAARWADHDGLDDVMRSLAAMRDGWGPLPVKDLWVKLYSLLDEEGQRPKDTSGEEIEDADRMTWMENPQGIIYKTFRTKIGSYRKELSKK